MLSLTANQAKTRFGELMNKAQHKTVTITQNGRTAFACLPPKSMRPMSNSSWKA
ncbi:type II toxin-antitoxin system prevent-host-death family antitoxin [Candidatus Pantoea persica]|uniref:type II toxin-antitoxin system prevent-host-death family antitoxin n=1 Tax=Candidatus Pantoea persica TaxID=2518128 RepID=UPI0028681A26|nr:type II toxin-antitoxin system prevent-host-death family antitoxin [Candidatus Pantoea persica]MBA2814135.1 prevent-host-death family protein [Candidatus Pantoea persica]